MEYGRRIVGMPSVMDFIDVHVTHVAYRAIDTSVARSMLCVKL